MRSARFSLGRRTVLHRCASKPPARAAKSATPRRPRCRSSERARACGAAMLAWVVRRAGGCCCAVAARRLRCARCAAAAAAAAAPLPLAASAAAAAASAPSAAHAATALPLACLSYCSWGRSVRSCSARTSGAPFSTCCTRARARLERVLCVCLWTQRVLVSTLCSYICCFFIVARSEGLRAAISFSSHGDVCGSRGTFLCQSDIRTRQRSDARRTTKCRGHGGTAQHSGPRRALLLIEYVRRQHASGSYGCWRDRSSKRGALPKTVVDMQ